MTYLSTSAFPFMPRLAGLIPAPDTPAGDTHLYAVLNAGDALIGVRVAPESADADEPRQRQRAVAGPTLEALLSVSSGPTSAVRWAGPRDADGSRVNSYGGSSQNGSYDDSTGGFRRHSVMTMRSWTLMETDTVLSRALAATLRVGYCVVDYEVHLLDIAHGVEDTQTSAVAAVVSVLRASGADQTARGCPLRGKDGWRTVVSVVECPLGHPRPPSPRLLFSVEIPPAPDHAPGASASSSGGGPPTLRAVAAARARLAAFRRAAHVPPGAALKNGATLTNAGAVVTGMSVEALKHPTQPICVLGWNDARRT
jgi:hypothetical protein